MTAKSGIKDENTEPTAQRVIRELAALRSSVDDLRNSLGFGNMGIIRPEEGTGVAVFISRSTSPSKPFLVRCEGAIVSSFKLSAVRAAIFLVLLLDLEDRLEGGKGINDPLAAIGQTLLALEPKSSEAENGGPERVRVAVYRFWEFCQSTSHLRGTDIYLDFDDKKFRLTPRRLNDEDIIQSLKIEITSTDGDISAILAQALSRSPIEQVRKRRALYVPPGPDAADRLLLEMYDHPFELTVTSLYVRPPLPSYPDLLLEKIAVSPRVLRRKVLAFEGYRTGRFNFFEVLNEGTIWDLIRYSPGTGFKLYPRSITSQDVIAHLDNLIAILVHYESYHLFITSMVVPFVVVTYDIHSGPIPEAFTVFFQAFSSAAERDLGCFAMYDRALYQSISDHIVRWLIDHPATIRNRTEVISYLNRVRDHLAEKGPLAMTDPIPSEG
jgi:hypothetical protein